eukprot:13517730-Heterocapsa_arctica.AAC.1
MCCEATGLMLADRGAGAKAGHHQNSPSKFRSGKLKAVYPRKPMTDGINMQYILEFPEDRYIILE